VIFFQCDLLSLIGPWLDRIVASFRNLRATLFIRMPGAIGSVMKFKDRAVIASFFQLLRLGLDSLIF
jgi:hypothetical protein